MLLLVLYGDFQEKTRWKPSVCFLFYQARAYSKLETVFLLLAPPLEQQLLLVVYSRRIFREWMSHPAGQADKKNRRGGLPVD